MPGEMQRVAQKTKKEVREAGIRLYPEMGSALRYTPLQI